MITKVPPELILRTAIVAFDVTVTVSPLHIVAVSVEVGTVEVDPPQVVDQVLAVFQLPMALDLRKAAEAFNTQRSRKNSINAFPVNTNLK